MIYVNVKDYSEFPGPRKSTVGPNSGEVFRETKLLPEILANPSSIICVNLDGTAGYGSSFLEEAFGGLIRRGVSLEKTLEICDNLISNEDDSLVDEIREYVLEAYEESKKNKEKTSSNE
jgi:hypothetical protein